MSNHLAAREEKPITLPGYDLLARVAELTERVASGEATADEARSLMAAKSLAWNLTRALGSRASEAMVAWIDRNGELVDGEVRYYVGVARETDCVDKAATLDALLTATGGDMARVAELMSSDPFKHGACKSVLDEATWGRCFAVMEKPDVRTGKAKREIKSTREEL